MVVVQVAFASIATSGKLALNGGLPPLALAALRILGATLVLAVVFVVQGRRRPKARDLPLLFMLALLGIGLNQMLFLVGLSHTTAVNAMILITTIPVFTLIVAVVFGRERFDLVRSVGTVVALAGTLVLLRVEDFRLDDAVVLGNLLIVLNALSYSIYLVFVDGMIRRYGSLSVIAWVFLLAAPVVVPIGMPSLAGALDAGAVTPQAWWALLWVVLVPTVIAYGGTTYTRKHLSASTVGASVFLQPLAGIAIALAVLPEETLTPRALVAGGLILSGVALVWIREPWAKRAGTGKPISIDLVLSAALHNVTLSLKKNIPEDQLRSLLDEAEWSQGRTSAQLTAQLHKSHMVFSAWEGSKLVGFARLITDNSYIVTILDFIVAKSHQGKGVGGRLIKSMIGHPDLIGISRWVVFSPINQDFFRQFDFEPTGDCLVRYG